MPSEPEEKYYLRISGRRLRLAHREGQGPSDVEEELHNARRISKAGVVSMDVLFGCHVAILAVVAIAVMEPTALGFVSVGEKALLVLSSLTATLGTISLVRFVRGLAKGVEPFGGMQVRRLLIAAFLFAAHVVLDYVAPTFDEVVVRLPLGELSLYGSSGGPVINLTSVSFVVFLFVLAGAVRYADALKRDSDSIL